MSKRAFEATAPFQSIRNTARITGLSAFYLRERCKAQTIPVIKVGSEYRINVPLLLEQLAHEATIKAFDALLEEHRDAKVSGNGRK